jgi:hypothetical protein
MVAAGEKYFFLWAPLRVLPAFVSIHAGEK